jgi:flagellar biosynthesis protein FlhF
MDVKEFRQPTVREAFRAIREDLGPDALVLSSDLVPARGWRGWMGLREVKVTAAPPAGGPARRPVVTERRPADSQAPINHVAARLIAAGIAPDLANRAATRVPAKVQRGASLPTLKKALAEELAPLVSGEEAYSPVEIFIGPPGVGKTTTIAKIAAQARARQGRLLGMVAADAFRAGAVEQLRTYAAIIGSPFRIARSAEDFGRALGNGRQPMLVDTAGRSHAEAGIRDLHRLVGKRPVRTHLVIAADTSVKTATRILDAYQDAGPDRCVISKIDEADSLMPLLGLLQARGLPVSYLTAGQRVPEDLDVATPAALAATLLRDTRPAGAAA